MAPASAEAPAAPKAGAGDAQSIKVDIKATHDATTPVELLVKPADTINPAGTGAADAHEALASTLPLEAPAAAPELEVKTPAPTPQPEAKTPAPAPQSEVKTPAPQTPAPQTPAPQPEEAAQPVQKEVSPRPPHTVHQHLQVCHAQRCVRQRASLASWQRDCP